VVLTHKAVEISINGSPWKSWDVQGCEEGEGSGGVGVVGGVGEGRKLYL
jgi:hypothetical protein